QRPNHYLLDLVISDFAPRAGARFVQQAFQLLGYKPLPPLADHPRPDPHFLRHRFVVQTGRAAQYEPCSQSQLLRHRATSRAPLQRRPFPAAQYQTPPSAALSACFTWIAAEHYLHGAICRPAPNHTAFALRQPGYTWRIFSAWRDSNQADVSIKWVKDLSAA